MSEIRWPTKEEDDRWDRNHLKECTSVTGHCVSAKRVSKTETRLRCRCGWLEVIPYTSDWEKFCEVWNEKARVHSGRLG